MKRLLPLVSLFVVAGAQAATVGGFDLNAYGFLRASAIYSTEALATFNNVNLSSPTHAVGQLPSRPQDKTSRMHFETHQSRFGVIMKKGEDLSGKLEFDFIDFNKSSPTTQSNPRVRIASITYNFDAHNKIIVGQDWDLFSPVTAYTWDIVGLYFLAGNSGFMRQQFQFLHDNEDWEVGAAVGMAGNNPGTTDNDLELGKGPTYSTRISRKLSRGRVGLSGIYAHLSYDPNLTAPGWSTDAYAGNAFYEQEFDGGLGIKSEVYYGQNLNNIGALTIGRGTVAGNVKEYGGTLTANKKVSETGFIFGGVGLAKAEQKSQVAPLVITAGGVITSPGVTSNFLSRVGYNYLITPDFSWITELSRYETQSRIATNHYQNVIAYSLDSGFQLRF